MKTASFFANAGGPDGVLDGVVSISASKTQGFTLAASAFLRRLDRFAAGAAVMDAIKLRT